MPRYSGQDASLTVTHPLFPVCFLMRLAQTVPDDILFHYVWVNEKPMLPRP